MRSVPTSLPSGPPGGLSLVPNPLAAHPIGSLSPPRPLERAELLERFPSVNFGIDEWLAALSGRADVRRRIALDLTAQPRVLS